MHQQLVKGGAVNYDGTLTVVRLTFLSAGGLLEKRHNQPEVTKNRAACETIHDFFPYFGYFAGPKV